MQEGYLTLHCIEEVSYWGWIQAKCTLGICSGLLERCIQRRAALRLCTRSMPKAQVYIGLDALAILGDGWTYRVPGESQEGHLLRFPEGRIQAGAELGAGSKQGCCGAAPGGRLQDLAGWHLRIGSTGGHVWVQHQPARPPYDCEEAPVPLCPHLGRVGRLSAWEHC